MRMHMRTKTSELLPLSLAGVVCRSYVASASSMAASCYPLPFVVVDSFVTNLCTNRRTKAATAGKAQREHDREWKRGEGWYAESGRDGSERGRSVVCR